MEHWAQKCDGAGCSPAEYNAVCRERDELKAAYEGAQLALKALNEKLAAGDAELQKVSAELHETKSDRDTLVKILRRSLDACEYCRHESLSLPCGDLDYALECEDCTLEKGVCCNCHGGNNFELKDVKEEQI